MRKSFKKLFCCALVLVMVFSCVPATISASQAVALPTAQVTEIEESDYTFALNFKANQATEEQLAYYGNWYADYVLTINKTVTFNANGTADGYLAGQYDAWSKDWVKVPAKSATINANEPLRIMAFGAELLGKKGLKYTYTEIYKTVKDFDCGIYFTPEFLDANLDLEVSLELRVFNNENEAESYAIGEKLVFVNPKNVVKNESTGEVYEDITDAIVSANEGDTVVLLDNVKTSGDVSVYEDVTLNLNGHVLESKYATVYGNIVDNSADNSGRLVVAPERLMFRESNEQLPIYTETGFCFADVVGFNQKLQSGTFGFQPLFEDFANPLLAAGTDATKVSVQVKLQWTVGTGAAAQIRTQYVEYADEFVKQFVNSYNSKTGKYGMMFTLKIANAADYPDLTYTIMAVSSTGVSITPAA